MTNQELVDQALLEAGVIDEGSSGTAVQSSDAMTKLNQMMALWAISDKDLHYFPQDTLGDTTPIPIWAESGVINSLAVVLAPSYGLPVTPLLYEKAKEGENAIARTVINGKLENTDMSHLPAGRGSGHSILTDS